MHLVLHNSNLLGIELSYLVHVNVGLHHCSSGQDQELAFSFNTHAQSTICGRLELQSIHIVRIYEFSVHSRRSIHRTEHTAGAKGHGISKLNSSKFAVRDELQSRMHGRPRAGSLSQTLFNAAECTHICYTYTLIRYTLHMFHSEC